MTVSATDVPALFDVVFNDGAGNVNGYVLVKDDATGLFYRPRRASYGTTPTFVERSNVQGDYGDNQQDFWITFSQKDFSLGEGQKYFRSNDPDKVRRYLEGAYIDVTSVEGQVSVGRDVIGSAAQAGTSSAASTVRCLCAAPNGNGIAYACSDNHGYYMDYSGVKTNLGAYTSGGTAVAIETDGTFGLSTKGQLYLSNGTKIDRYDGSWHNFSSTAGAAYLAYLNQSLYGLGTSTGASTALIRWDTSGAPSTLFTWKGATGNSSDGLVSAERKSRRIVAYGGKLAILIESSGTGASVWIYDGTAPAKVMDLPLSFVPSDIHVLNGTIFVAGVDVKNLPVVGQFPVATVYYYASGTFGQLWQSFDSGSYCYLSSLGRYLVIVDTLNGAVFLYDSSRGGVTRLNRAGGTAPTFVAEGFSYNSGDPRSFFAVVVSGTQLGLYPFTSTVPTSGYITTSLFDGESSLEKYFRSAKVDWEDTVGGLGSVDLAYQMDGVDGSWTTFKTGAASGTEYNINQTGNSISIQVTLNKGTSTLGPILKRVSVRAVPLLQQFRKNEYIFELSGVDGQVPLKLRNGRLHNLDGHTMATNLRTYIASQTPLTITDRFGTYTGIIEPDNSSIIEIRPGIYQAHVVCREI